MKTKEEIESRIAELKAQEKDFEPWLQQARERYIEDRKIWGNEADPTEVDHVLRLRKDLEVEYTALEWVLTESTHDLYNIAQEKGQIENPINLK